MNTTDATINGLMEGISVVEKDNNIDCSSLKTDTLYNDQEPYDLQGIYYDEGYTVSCYSPEDFGQAITLTSMTDEYGFKLNND